MPVTVPPAPVCIHRSPTAAPVLDVGAAVVVVTVFLPFALVWAAAALSSAAFAAAVTVSSPRCKLKSAVLSSCRAAVSAAAFCWSAAARSVLA